MTTFCFLSLTKLMTAQYKMMEDQSSMINQLVANQSKKVANGQRRSSANFDAEANGDNGEHNVVVLMTS